MIVLATLTRGRGGCHAHLLATAAAKRDGEPSTEASCSHKIQGFKSALNSCSTVVGPTPTHAWRRSRGDRFVYAQPDQRRDER